MSPPWIDSTYGQYRSASFHLAAWLLETANEAKAEREGLPGTSCHKYPTILDAEFFKLINANQGRVPIEEDDATSIYLPYQISEDSDWDNEGLELYDREPELCVPKRRIPKIVFLASHFEELAAWIGELYPSVEVPSWVVATLDRLDDIRSTLLQDLTLGPDAPQADGVLLYLGIFNRVRALLGLEARVRGPPPPQTDPDDKSPPVHPDYLHQHQREAEEPDADLVALYKGRVYFPMAHEQAAEFFGMLVHDLNKIRDRVRGSWTDVAFSGDYDPAVAAVSTDWALKLSRILIGDQFHIFKVFPSSKLSGHWYLMNMRARIFSGAETDGYTITSKTLRGTWGILDDFFREDKHTSSTNLQLPQWGDYGVYNPELDRNDMTNAEKLAEDRVILMDMVGQLMTVTCLMPSTFPAPEFEDDTAEQLWWEDACKAVKFPIADEFMLLVGEARKRAEVTMQLVFAAQVFLDIHHTLRKDVEKVYLYCMDEINRVVDALTEHFADKGNVANTHPDWKPEDNMALVELVEKTKWIFADPIQCVKRDELTSIHWQNPIPETMPHNAMLRSSPVLSGLLAYHFRVEMHREGLYICDTWGSVSYTWHLYNACKQEGLLNGDFVDLDRTYDLLVDSEDMYPDTRPTNINECWKEFCRNLGLAESLFDYPPTPRARRYPIVTYSTFAKRYGTNSGKFDWSDVTPCWVNPTKMEAADLFKKAADMLQGERTQLYFPWIEMHNACCWFLGNIKDHLHDVLSNVMQVECGQEFPGLEDKLPFLVGFILASAKGRMGNPPDMGPLNTAARALQHTIDAGESDNVTERWRTFWDVEAGVAGQALDEKKIIRHMEDNYSSKILKEVKDDNHFDPPTFDQRMEWAKMDWGDQIMWKPVPPPRKYTVDVEDGIAYRHVLVVREEDDW